MDKPPAAASADMKAHDAMNKPVAAPAIAPEKNEKPKELDKALLTLLQQLPSSELHSSTSLQHIIATLLAKECCSTESLKRAIKNGRLEQWFPNADVTCDLIKELFSASGPTTVQPSGTQQLAPCRIQFQRDNAAPLELSFPKRPSVAEILQSLGKNAPPKATLYMKTPSRSYVPVDGGYLVWADYAETNGIFKLRVQDGTPENSPEKEKGESTSEVATKLAQLSVSAPQTPRKEAGTTLALVRYWRKEQVPQQDRTLDLLAQQRSRHSSPPHATAIWQGTARQIGERFSMQHDGQLRETVWGHVLDNWKAWNLQDGIEAKKRSVRSFCVGGASGTGKTRFGSELPQLLWMAAKESKESVPMELHEALKACQQRSYVLKFAFGRSAELVSPKDPIGPYAAELLWAAYMDAFFGGERVPTPGKDPEEVYKAISRIERQATKELPAVVAVVVHLDEVQNSSRDGPWLDFLVSALLSPFNHATPPAHGILPIVYLSGVNKLLFQPTPSTQHLLSLSLPIVTVENYSAILRDLLSLKPDWTPNPPLRRALSSIEGPPRLLELLLWAAQAVAPLTSDLIITDVDLKKVEEKLKKMNWRESVEVLYTAMASLGHAGLITYHQEVLNLGPVARCVMGHVLLASKLQLEQPLIQEPKRLTTNDVVLQGLAHSVAVADDCYRLHWPPLYFWAIYKFNSNRDPDLGPPPATPQATSPGILYAKDAEEGPPRNERADIALMCLRVFMAGQHALASLSAAAPKTVGCPLSAIMPLAPTRLASIGVDVPVSTRLAVRDCPHSVSDTASYERLLKPETLPPCAWKNVQRAKGPDSLLFLRLVAPAPKELQGPSYRPKNATTLAILIQSKQQRSPEGRRRDPTSQFESECEKAASCPFPYLFVMISDSERTPAKDPKRAPNELFVGQEQLGNLYGAVLLRMRLEEWHMSGKEDRDP